MDKTTTLGRTEFEELLFLYGPEIGNWPAHSRLAAEDALAASPALRILLMEEKKLNAAFSNRTYIPPSPDFANRIINLARTVPQYQKMRTFEWLHRAFADCMLPQPAYAFASLLILGLLLGFGVSGMESSLNDPKEMQNFLYDYGGVL